MLYGEQDLLLEQRRFNLLIIDHDILSYRFDGIRLVINLAACKKYFSESTLTNNFDGLEVFKASLVFLFGDDELVFWLDTQFVIYVG